MLEGLFASEVSSIRKGTLYH